MTDEATEPPSPKVSKEHTITRRILAALAAALVFLATACGAAGDTRFSDAVEELGSGAELLDDGQGLYLNGLGNESLGMPIESIIAYLDYLEAPDSVLMKMGNTRALDGTQTASWDNIVATWTYHPDEGLDIILTYDYS